MKETGGPQKRGRTAKTGDTATSPASLDATGSGSAQPDAVVGFEEKLWQMADTVAIERDNQGVLPKAYGRAALDKTRLAELIDLVGTIGLGDKANRSRDILGRIHEYLLTRFAAVERKNGGQFYTPRSVVRVLVEMLAPYKGRVFDPCCGSGGMFQQAELLSDFWLETGG